MENHGCKGCLTPSLCINYPPNLSFYLKGFSCSFSLSDNLDKIKVGGDSCYPHILIKSQFTVLQREFKPLQDQTNFLITNFFLFFFKFHPINSSIKFNQFQIIF